jgi:hypothetical protein
VQQGILDYLDSYVNRNLAYSVKFAEAIAMATVNVSQMVAKSTITLGRTHAQKMFLSKNAESSIVDLMLAVMVGSVPTVTFKASVELVDHFTDPTDVEYLTADLVLEYARVDAACRAALTRARGDQKAEDAANAKYTGTKVTGTCIVKKGDK